MLKPETDLKRCNRLQTDSVEVEIEIKKQGEEKNKKIITSLGGSGIKKSQKGDREKRYTEEVKMKRFHWIKSRQENQYPRKRECIIWMVGMGLM